MGKILKVNIDGHIYTVESIDINSTPIRVRVDGTIIEVEIDSVSDLSFQTANTKPPEPGVSGTQNQEKNSISSNISSRNVSSGQQVDIKSFVTPMPGVIISVNAKVGDQIVTGDEVCVLEAMKMQQVLRADWTGIVKTIYVESGQQVLDGDTILDLE